MNGLDLDGRNLRVGKVQKREREPNLNKYKQNQQ